MHKLAVILLITATVIIVWMMHHKNSNKHEPFRVGRQNLDEVERGPSGRPAGEFDRRLSPDLGDTTDSSADTEYLFQENVSMTSTLADNVLQQSDRDIAISQQSLNNNIQEINRAALMSFRAQWSRAFSSYNRTVYDYIVAKLSSSMPPNLKDRATRISALESISTLSRIVFFRKIDQERFRIAMENMLLFTQRYVDILALQNSVVSPEYERAVEDAIRSGRIVGRLFGEALGS